MVLGIGDGIKILKPGRSQLEGAKSGRAQHWQISEPWARSERPALFIGFAEFVAEF